MRFIVLVGLAFMSGILGYSPSVAALGNDELENAVIIAHAPAAYIFDTTSYNSSPDPSDPEVECGSADAGFERQTRTAWFTFTPATGGEFRASTEGTTEVSTVMALWTASDGEIADLVACNWRTSVSPPDHSSIPAAPASPGPALVAGQQYLLEIASYENTKGGSIHLAVEYSGLLAPHAVPSISMLSPGGAPVGSGTLALTITGSGFANVSTVHFGEATLAPSTWAPTSLAVSIPANLLTGEAEIPVSVSNPAPGGGQSGSVAFTVYPVPGIVSIAPQSVVSGSEATTIFLVGTGFRSGISQATIDGVARETTVTGPTTAEVVLEAADLASPGPLPIVVTNSAGGGAAASSAATLLLVRERLDIDCSGEVNGLDALALLRQLAGMSQPNPGCPLAIEDGAHLAGVLQIRYAIAGLEPPE